MKQDFSYRRRLKQLPLHHQAVQGSLCSKPQSQASNELVVPQDRNHTLVNALISLCSLSVLGRGQAIEQPSCLGQCQTTKF